VAGDGRLRYSGWKKNPFTPIYSTGSCLLLNKQEMMVIIVIVIIIIIIIMFLILREEYRMWADEQAVLRAVFRITRMEESVRCIQIAHSTPCN